MFEPLLETKLKTGEPVYAAVVHGPDPQWADRVEPMLAHKGDPWNWQNSELLRESTGVAAKFYVLHRAGQPFANIMVVESAGVALLGHVWTDLADRGTGASSILMELVLDHFRRDNGQAVFLGTDSEGEAFRYYERRGFARVAPGSRYMMLSKEPADVFFEKWFGGEPAQVEPLDWPHWPAAAPLCLAGFPDQVRLAATGLIGRCSSEGRLLPLLRRQRQHRVSGQPDCAVVLSDVGGVVWGIASLMPDPMWPGQEVLDVFCHPRAWHRAPELLAALPFGSGRSWVAYTDSNAAEKNALLAAHGFLRLAELPDWLPGPAAAALWRRTA